MPLKASDIDKDVLEKCPDSSCKKHYLMQCFVLKFVERITYAFLISTLGGLAWTVYDFLVI